MAQQYTLEQTMADEHGNPEDSEGQSVTQWIRNLEAGDSIANQQIWQRYYARLVELARSRLRSDFRRVADEEDIALDALNSLFQGVSAGRFPKLDDRTDLWRLLLTITERKAMALARYHSRRKRGSGLVRGESVFGVATGSTERHAGLDSESPLPTPEAAAEIAETIRALLNQLGDQQLTSIAIKKLEGYSVEEIAQLMQCSVRTVKRKLQRIRTVWSEQSFDGDFEFRESEAD